MPKREMRAKKQKIIDDRASHPAANSGVAQAARLALSPDGGGNSTASGSGKKGSVG